MEHGSFFQFAIEQALEMMIVFDKDKKILYANPTAENTLKYPGFLKGKSMMDLFSMEERSFEKIQRTKGEVVEGMAYRGNRTCFAVKIKIVPYGEGKSEKQPLYLCIMQDISTEKFLEKKIAQVEEEAKQASKIKSEFVASVTHELRTPVNGILGNTQELMSREMEWNSRKLLLLIERGCRDMNNLINNILDFSKLEAGKFMLDCRKFHFRNMLEYVKGNHNNRMLEKGLGFEITVSPEVPEYVIGDDLRIVQILNNLLSNAYKFTSVGGVHLEIIKTAQKGRSMELFFMIVDSGIGIAKEKQDKLFKSFSQVDMSVSRKYGGTGLGLNICKQLVELMGGEIHVESTPGQGTTFSFHIWVEIPEEDTWELTKEKETEECTDISEQELLKKLQKVNVVSVNDNIWKYGTVENRDELQKKISKLMLSVLMENWEKAEMLSETVKQLLEDAPKEVKGAAFRMKMAVQKEDTKKVTDSLERLRKIMEDSNGNGK